jgi:hypothetical protein
VQPLAGPLLRQLSHQWRWMAVRVLRLLMSISVEQPQCRSWSLPRQLLVPVEPELQPSLAELARHRFAHVQVAPPVAGQRLHRLPLPWSVRAAGALR